MADHQNTKKTKSYHEQTQIDNTLRLREVLKTLPLLQKIIFVQ